MTSAALKYEPGESPSSARIFDGLRNTNGLVFVIRTRASQATQEGDQADERRDDGLTREP